MRSAENGPVCPCMDEGRKRELAIVAGILVARHLKTTDDLFDSRSSPRNESLVATAVQWENTDIEVRECQRGFVHFALT